MVTPMLRELAGRFPPFIPFEETWFLHDRGVRHLLDAWDAACRQAVRSGSAEELHAIRDDYQAVLLGHLKILDGYSLLVSRFEPEQARAERLGHCRNDLQKHYDALFPRWQTIDDLEAILLERVSPSNEQLKTLAASHAPPQAWFDENHDALATPE